MPNSIADNAALLYQRDRIVVGKDLPALIRRLCGGAPSGKTVVLAARSIVHDPPDYSLRLGAGGDGALTGLSLVVVADNFQYFHRLMARVSTNATDELNRSLRRSRDSFKTGISRPPSNAVNATPTTTSSTVDSTFDSGGRQSPY
jgi:hypothetical protein